MLSNSLKRLNKTNRLITVDDVSDLSLAGRSAGHTACWKYLELASYDSALEYSENLIRKEPEKPDGYILKARALFKLKRFKESEQVLLHVMKICLENDLIRSDVEGMIKLKDELANSRVEILRCFNFRDAIDIAEMHWNDCTKPITELIGFTTLSKNRCNPSAKDESQTPMNVDIEIIDIIGAERAKQIYPELLLKSPKSNSKPEMSTYSARRAISSTNLSLSADFPTRESPKKTPQKESTNNDSNEAIDSELRTAALRTALMLAEEKNDKYEKNIYDLEEELKKVYTHLIRINGEKKAAEKRADQLKSELEAIELKNYKKSFKSPKIRVFTNSNRAHNRSSNGDEFSTRISAEFPITYGMPRIRDINDFEEFQRYDRKMRESYSYN